LLNFFCVARMCTKHSGTKIPPGWEPSGVSASPFYYPSSEGTVIVESDLRTDAHFHRSWRGERGRDYHPMFEI
jgi:hypothetical protein